MGRAAFIDLEDDGLADKAWHSRAQNKNPAKAGFSRSRPEGHFTKSMDIPLRRLSTE